MKKTFFKNLLRDIQKSISRFLSIIIIIAVGVSFYTGIRATSPSMKISADTYFDKNNFMDFNVISTLGLTKNDVSAIKKIKGVTGAEGAYSMDAVIEKDKHQLVMNVNSLPTQKGINDIKMIKGTRPQLPNEAVIEKKFLDSNKLNLGDTITVESGNDSNIANSLKNTKFKIVGTAESSLYISEQRQPSSVGNGIVRGFLYIVPEVFKNEVYTEVYVRSNTTESKYSLLDNKSYTSYIKNIEKSLKDIGVSRNEIRYAEVLKAGNDKLNKAQSKLETSKKEAEEKFSEAGNKIDIGKTNLIKGFEELNKSQLLFNEEMNKRQIQIAEGKEQLISAENELNIKKQQLESAKLQLGQENPKIKASEAELNKALAELEAKKTTLTQSEAQLDAAKKETTLKFDDGRKKLEDGKKELHINIKKLEDEKEKASLKIKDGESELQKNREKLNEIKKPDWYVLSRSQNAGYETYIQDSDRLDSIGKAFPLIFFLVSALVSLTTMTRMVQEKRIEIGTLKALGYSRITIVSHYLIYALSASILGSIIGVLLGFRLFPPLLMKAYATRYTIGDKIIPFDKNLAFMAAMIAILFTAVAAISSTLEELREVPASLMRPKPPKSGKKIFLEKIGFIWKRLNFTKKVTARNIFRYKQRLFMTVIGIAACSGLMITGFGLKEGILGAVDAQFNKVYKYDMKGTLSQNLSESSKNALKVNTSKVSNVKSILFTYSKNASIKLQDDRTQDCYIVSPENTTELNKYINLADNKDLKLNNDGVIITKKLSKILDKKPGDSIDITLENKTFKAKISGITEHYLQHYIYIGPAYYEKVTGKKITFNSYYGLLNNLSKDAENNTLNALKNFHVFNSVEFKNNLHIDFNKITSAINSIIPVLIVSAGVLAFVVIFNLTNINISERKRELATIKLLGFYNHELAAYIYRENIILTFLGSLAGIPVGMLINKFIIGTAETNDIMFLQNISPIYYLYSILLTLLFSIIVNLAMYKRFDKIDMIESLKSAE